MWVFRKKLIGNQNLGFKMWTESFTMVWLKELKTRAEKGDKRAEEILRYINEHGVSGYLLKQHCI